MNIKGTKSVDHFHKLLGKQCGNMLVWLGMKKGLKKAMTEIKKIRTDFGMM